MEVDRPTTLVISIGSGMIRGYEDFYAAGSGLTGSLLGLNDSIDGPNTSLAASISLGSWQSDSAIPPDVAHATWPGNDYPNSLVQVTGDNAFQFLFRPDGAAFVYDYANASLTTTVVLSSAVPLPGALFLFALAATGLLPAMRVSTGHRLRGDIA